MSNNQTMSYQNGGIREVRLNDGCDDARNETLLHQSSQPQKAEEQKGHIIKKTREGIVLLFLSAFLFSFMGMFLQFTGRLGLPSTEMVFIRAAFQGTFVVVAMIICRVDATSYASMEDEGVDDDIVLMEEKELLNEEKKLEEGHSGHTIQQQHQRSKYNTLSVDATRRDNPDTNTTTEQLPPRIIQHPFGTNKTMINVVILRGVIGGFGFCNFYYTYSTLPLGDATTLLSLYPIVTIFLARFVLGEEIKPLQVIAAILSLIGATLISRPTFLFGNDIEELQSSRPLTLGYVTALIGSLCASGVIVMIRKAGKVGAHTLQLLFSWAIFGMANSIIIGAVCAWHSEDQQWRIPSREELPYVLGICIAGSFAHFLLNYAAKLVPATVAGLVRSSDIFWAYLLGIIVLEQHPQTITFAGVLFVCSSLVLILIESNKKTIMKHVESIGNLTAAK
eukprot:scaffold7444_cov149-Skeletonema_menzelii.AAC.6